MQTRRLGGIGRDRGKRGVAIIPCQAPCPILRGDQRYTTGKARIPDLKFSAINMPIVLFSSAQAQQCYETEISVFWIMLQLTILKKMNFAQCQPCILGVLFPTV